MLSLEEDAQSHPAELGYQDNCYSGRWGIRKLQELLAPGIATLATIQESESCLHHNYCLQSCGLPANFVHTNNECPMSCLSMSSKLATGNQDATTAKHHDPLASSKNRSSRRTALASLLHSKCFTRVSVWQSLKLHPQCQLQESLGKIGFNFPVFIVEDAHQNRGKSSGYLASQFLDCKIFNFSDLPIYKIRIISLSQGHIED